MSALPTLSIDDWEFSDLTDWQASAATYYPDVGITDYWLPAPYVGSSPIVWDSASLSDCLEFIHEISQLPDDWDGYGAARISPDIVKKSVHVLETLALKPTDIAPHPSGTIMLEWESYLGRAYVEIGSSRYNVFIKRHEGSSYALVGPSDALLDGPTGTYFESLWDGTINYPTQPQEISALEYDREFVRGR